MAVPRVISHQAEFSEIEQAVLAAYQADPSVADSDKRLVLVVWQREGLQQLLGDRWQAFHRWFLIRATLSDSITRAGRRLRSQGLIRASPGVAQARKELAQGWREAMRGGR